MVQSICSQNWNKDLRLRPSGKNSEYFISALAVEASPLEMIYWRWFRWWKLRPNQAAGPPQVRKTGIHQGNRAWNFKNLPVESSALFYRLVVKSRKSRDGWLNCSSVHSHRFFIHPSIHPIMIHYLSLHPSHLHQFICLESINQFIRYVYHPTSNQSINL